jgi:hypothetical protein
MTANCARRAIIARRIVELLRAPFVLAIANNFPVAKNGDISTFRFFDAVF